MSARGGTVVTMITAAQSAGRKATGLLLAEKDRTPKGGSRRKHRWGTLTSNLLPGLT